MALTWTPEMGNVSPHSPALEDIARGAIIAACEFFDAGNPNPVFDGGVYPVPIGDDAKRLEAACMTGVPSGMTPLDRSALLSLAVACGLVYRAAGGGAGGWAEVGRELARSRKALTSGRTTRNPPSAN